ncbi:MAG: molybdopterin-dependent oxidoreductase [Candidatus Heimdallarchaeota archaeon]
MNKKHVLVLVISINVLFGSALTTVYFTGWEKLQSGEEGFLTVTGLPIGEVRYTIEELMAMPNITREYLLQGTPTFTANYTGVSVFYLLTEKLNLTEGSTRVKVVAVDNYSYTLTLAECNATRDIILAYLRNGERLKSGAKGGNGPLRLIIPQRFSGEYNAQYCVKYVTTLKILD